MIRKAAKGKIGYIITKSISRVSIDTLEVLKIIRFLRELGINMHFENEKLDSIEADKEFEILFDLYLQGLSFEQIKSFLESQGIKTATGTESKINS